MALNLSAIRPFILVLLFLFDLYALTHIFVIPGLFVAAVIITLIVLFPDKFMSLIYKLQRRKRAPQTEKKIEIPEGTPQTIPLPKIPEKLEPTQETLKQLVEMLRQANENMMLLQSQIAEIRSENDRLKKENEELKRTVNVVQRWLNGKDVKEALAQVMSSLWLRGAPVTDRAGNKLGRLVAIVPNPIGKGLMLITEDARGVLKPVGWGMTWADERYFPLVDPECWKAIQEEMRQWNIQITGSDKSLSFAFEPIKEHAIVLSQWATRIPSYIDPLAELEHSNAPPPSINIENKDAAEIIKKQRDEIDRLKKLLNRYSHENDMLRRQLDYMKNVAIAYEMQLADTESSLQSYPIATTELLKELEVDSERADLHRLRADVQEAVSKEQEEIYRMAVGRRLQQDFQVAGTDRLDLTKKTLEQIREIISAREESPEAMLARAAQMAVASELLKAKASETKTEAEGGEKK